MWPINSLLYSALLPNCISLAKHALRCEFNPQSWKDEAHACTEKAIEPFNLSTKKNIAFDNTEILETWMLPRMGMLKKYVRKRYSNSTAVGLACDGQGGNCDAEQQVEGYTLTRGSSWAACSELQHQNYKYRTFSGQIRKKMWFYPWRTTCIVMVSCLK